MSVKEKFVAIELENGTCKRVLECKTILDSEYKKLVNESKQEREKEKRHDSYICFEISRNRADIVGYELFIAKSIYDNMVDSGYFQSDETFEKAFYDFVFENKKIECDLPKEFKVILEKVRGK